MYMRTQTHTLARARAHLGAQELSAERAYEILRRISDEDCQTLGFNTKWVRPDWMLITALPVPPPPVRPSVMMDSSARCAVCCGVGRRGVSGAVLGGGVRWADLLH